MRIKTRCVQCGRPVLKGPWCGPCEMYWNFWLFVQGQEPELDPPYSKTLRREADEAEERAVRSDAAPCVYCHRTRREVPDEIGGCVESRDGFHTWEDDR